MENKNEAKSKLVLKIKKHESKLVLKIKKNVELEVFKLNVISPIAFLEDDRKNWGLREIKNWESSISFLR